MRGPGTPAADEPADAASTSPPSSIWSLPRALGLLERVCDVMAHAHNRGVIHRDLKPANVLVGPFGDVRVIDWGSAHVLPKARKWFEETFVPFDKRPVETDRADALRAAPGSPHATANSGQPITVLFMPPEILAGQSDQLGPETDVYSIGVMLYELLSGRLPYSRPDGSMPEPAELKQQILNGPPERLRRLDGGISRDLAAICEKAMAYRKTHRYRSMSELATDLRAFLDIRPVSARNPGPLLHLQKLVQRRFYHVFLAALLVVGTVVSVLVLANLKTQRDAARLRNLMSDAQLASRSGRWAEAVVRWNQTRTLHGHDPVELGLRLSEAFIVLSDKPKARAELDALLRRPDLGSRRSAVLLRMGEHEMFDRKSFEQGVRRVREALTNGLTAADAALAHGLVADSTPQALSYFREALRLDPYFHSAHRHSLGLELVLGRHDELSSHLQTAKTLYPSDFSPGAIEIVELALLGRPAEARAALAGYRGATTPEISARLERGIRLLDHVLDYFDVEVFLGERTNAVSRSDLVAEATQIFLARGMGDTTNTARGPLPQLPCVEQGLGAAFEGIKELALARVLGGMNRTEAAVTRIRDGWRHHPEALIPAFAGIYLDNQQPRTGPRDLRLLALQAEMYQKGVDSPSVLPRLPRLARVLAVDVQQELALSTHTNAAAFRADAVANLRRAMTDTNLAAVECRAYSRWASALGQHDLARQFLYRWEILQPADPSLLRNRIRLEMAVGAYGPAIKLIDQMLAANPSDRWAAAERKKVLEKISQLSGSVLQPAKAKE